MLKLKTNKVNILGTEYKIKFKNFKDDIAFEEKGWCGYCSQHEKLIVIGNHHTFPELENETNEYFETAEKEALRHEIIHAFFYESGLSTSALQYGGPWAKNEEMVDWFAIQSPKIFDVFKTLNLL